MSGMEEQLGAILGDPEMMQKIQALAQSMEQPGEAPPPKAPPPPAPGGGELEMVKAFAGFARGTEIDKDQRALLKALAPYISSDKIGKLEKAMRSAKLAKQASAMLESGALKNKR